MLESKTQIMESEALTPVAASEDMFTPSSDLTPAERFDDAIGKARKLVATDRSCANLSQWLIGSFYNELQKAPETYGLDEKLSQAELAEVIGCSAARVCSGCRLFRAYSFEELEQLMVLPNEVLLTAAGITKPERPKLLEGFAEDYREGVVTTDKMLTILDAALEKRQRITNASGVDQQGPPPRQLPIKPFKAAARKLIKTAQELRHELEGDQFGVLGDDLDEVQEAIGTLKDELSQLEECV